MIQNIFMKTTKTDQTARMRRLIWNIRWAQKSEGTVSHAVVQIFDYLVSVHGV